MLYKSVSNQNMSKTSDQLLDSLLKSQPQYFKHITADPAAFKVQIIYTEINRDKNNTPQFTHHFYGTDKAAYFYPASTVKMPMALMTLEKLNELSAFGVNRSNKILKSGDSLHQAKSIEDAIKSIFLVSDNDAFNDLYDFMGQEKANAVLHQKGYAHAEILHRLAVSLTPEQNRQTPALQLIDESGKVQYEQAAQQNQKRYSSRNEKLGNGYYTNGKLFSEPMDFSAKNKMQLTDLHQILQSVLFPQSVSKQQRFNLKDSDYAFVYQWMSAYPSESGMPKYQSKAYWDAYVKFLFYGAENAPVNPNIRIFNKVGNAYGQLTDVAYIVDFEHNVEFMLSATIYCNSDGILNDDQYDYGTIGYPFLKQLGRLIYQYDKNRIRQYKPDLTRFKFSYR